MHRRASVEAFTKIMVATAGTSPARASGSAQGLLVFRFPMFVARAMELFPSLATCGLSARAAVIHTCVQLHWIWTVILSQRLDNRSDFLNFYLICAEPYTGQL